MLTAKLSSKNQITIPKQVLRSLALAPGDRLLLEVRGNQIILRAPRKLKKPTESIYGSVKRKADAVMAIKEFRKTGGRA